MAVWVPRRVLIVLLGLGFSAAPPLSWGVSTAASSRPADPVVHVYRDRYGMAHLYADREEDGFYGLGYASGEDRLLSILMWFTAARGELAAKFGPQTPAPPTQTHGVEAEDFELRDAVASDIAVRKYQLLSVARRNFSRLPPQFQADLRAYVRGLSAYMRAHPEKVPPWAPKLEPALLLATYQVQANEARSVCEQRREVDRAAAGETVAANQTETPVLPLGASNAWAVAGSRTADGRVILGSDSHGSIETYGTTFYPFRIKAGALDVFAFDRPGTIDFLFGATPNFAWALTEAPRFVADCYRVRTDPGSPRTYQYDGVTKRILAVPYRIRVRNAPDITGTFEYTRHNGVLSPVELREGNTVYVVSYSGADRVGLGAGERYRIAIAKSRPELEAALAQRDAYPANLIIGGADGTIMYLRGGRIPVRAPGLDVRGTVDGNTSATAWRGIHNYADLLKLINPPQGYVSNSNISPDMMYPSPWLRPQDYPSYFAFEPGHTGTRQQRILELLDRAPALTTDGALAILMDETIDATRPWGPAIALLLAERPELLAGRSLQLRAFLDELARFDGAFSKGSRGALYHSILRMMLHDHHPDSMDALQAAVESGPRLQPEQQGLIVQAAGEAFDYIVAKYGRADLTWGDVHRIGRGDADFPIGGGVVVLGVQRGGWLWNQGYLGIQRPARSASSPRAIHFVLDPVSRIEWADGGERIPFLVHFAATGVQCFAQSLWGVSDDATSPHYADQSNLASDQVLRPIPLSIGALAQEHATQAVLSVGSQEGAEPTRQARASKHRY